MEETRSLNWRVPAAILFSAALVVGAYVLAGGIKSPTLAEASAETALLRALATRDSNGDGLPDWQNALYGIPLNSTTTDYFNLGMTNGEAVARGLIVPKAIAELPVATSSGDATVIDPSLPPTSPSGTLTDTFAKSFFALYLEAKRANGGAELLPSQTDTLAVQALDALSALVTAAADYKSPSDVTVSGSGAEALKIFAAEVEAVMQKNMGASGATKSELLYLQDAVERKDASALTGLVALAKMYRDTAAGLATLPVPQEVASDHLVFVNALMRLSGIVSDFARVNTDPLAAVLALKLYAEPGQALVDALTHMGGVYAFAGITLPLGMPGALFLQAINRYPATVEQTSQAL